MTSGKPNVEAIMLRENLGKPLLSRFAVLRLLKSSYKQRESASKFTLALGCSPTFSSRWSMVQDIAAEKPLTREQVFA